MYIFSSLQNLFTSLPVNLPDSKDILVIAHSNGFAKDGYAPSTVSQAILESAVVCAEKHGNNLCITGGNTASYWGHHAFSSSWTEADAQLQSLTNRSVKYIERISQNTRENLACIFREIQQCQGVLPREVVLVTHTNQIRRAVALARKMGLIVYAVPVRSQWSENNIPWFLRGFWRFWLREFCVYIHHILLRWV